MNPNTGSDTLDVTGALWIGALMLASAMIKDPFPPEIEEIAVHTSSCSADHKGVAISPCLREVVARAGGHHSRCASRAPGAGEGG